jgi:glycosyltransferase involved in cell wall biosynthesis
MIESYVCVCLPIASTDQMTRAGIEASGRQARSWVCALGLSHVFVIPTPRRRTAYIHGLEFCTGDFVIIMDADFSHHVRVFSDVMHATLKFSSPSSYLNLFGMSPGLHQHTRRTLAPLDDNKHTTLTSSREHGTSLPLVPK